MDIAKLRERTYLLQCLRIKMSSAASLAVAAAHVRGGRRKSERSVCAGMASAAATLSVIFSLDDDRALELI
jgi:hypothetical protein